MPSFDGGHYFFTALLPINNHGIAEHGHFKSSPVHMVRDALEALPTALQTRASETIGIQSPFARSLRTHFVRLFVIDAAYYNGRDTADSILSAIEKTDLLKAQPVDRMNSPYLVFVADFDPAPDGAPEPRSWLEELWTLSPRELSSVFEYCYGFDGKADAAAFASFVMKGEIDTTMPFNDYWTVPPPLPTMPLWPLALPPLAGLLIGAGVGWGTQSIWLGAIIALALAAAGIVYDYTTVMKVGATPFPTAPNSTLRDVLKALYLQQAFARFAAAQQRSNPAQLRAAFAKFVAETQPGDVTGPTQPPGVVRSSFAPEAL
ncbi:MAG TPA: hypothetical protein VGI95_14280 [Caulobacteraceae bacterium]|jgi:hypothetical protein